MRLALAVMRLTLAVMRCAEPGLVESLHVAGAAEIAGWPVTCEHGWFSGCGTQLTARMLGRRFAGFYVCLCGRHMTVIWCRCCQRSISDLLLKR